MSINGQNTSETSVAISLAELARLEAERVRDEEAQRARTRAREAQDKRDAEAKKREAEAQRLAAEAEARAKKDREEAIERARIEARERAAADVARIEAQAKARLEEENAQRAHELALLRVRTEGGAKKLRVALAVVIGVALLGGGGATVAVSRQVAALEQETATLREGQTALTHEREQAKQSELGALEKRHAALRERAFGAVAQAKALGLGRDVEEARLAAEAAHASVDAKALDQARLRAFADALDVLQTRVETLETVVALDRRKDDLDAWAGERRKSEALSTKLAAAKDAGQKARAAGAGKADAKAYETTLGQLREAIALAGTATGGRVTGGGKVGPVGAPCTPGLDPLCGPDGHLVTPP